MNLSVVSIRDCESTHSLALHLSPSKRSTPQVHYTFYTFTPNLHILQGHSNLHILQDRSNLHILQHHPLTYTF